MSNNMDVPARYLPCMVAGLAYYIASKPESIPLAPALKEVYEEQWNLAADASERRHRFTWPPVAITTYEQLRERIESLWFL